MRVWRIPGLLSANELTGRVFSIYTGVCFTLAREVRNLLMKSHCQPMRLEREDRSRLCRRKRSGPQTQCQSVDRGGLSLVPSPRLVERLGGSYATYWNSVCYFTSSAIVLSWAMQVKGEVVSVGLCCSIKWINVYIKQFANGKGMRNFYGHNNLFTTFLRSPHHLGFFSTLRF